MRPDDLMSLATAHGIDFVSVAQASAPDDQIRALTRYDGPIQKQSRAVREPEWRPEDAALACQGLEGRYYAAFAYRYAGDDGQRRPLWAALMVEASHLAVQQRWITRTRCAHCDGQGALTEIVRSQIDGKAERDPKTGVWRTQRIACPVCAHRKGRIGEVPVVAHLVDLAIFEEWLASHYATGLQELAARELWPVLIGIETPLWRRRIMSQYRALQATLDRWCGIAYGHATTRLREDDDDVA